MSDSTGNPDNLLRDHSFDGIQELDHPLPNWWLWMFLATIIFAFMYYVHYEIAGSGLTQNAELQLAMDEIQARKSQDTANQNTGPALSESDFAAALLDSGKLAAGKEIFTGKCAACHGDVGQGLIGPNLTDQYWIYGKGKAMEILHVVQKGVLDKGMPPWEAVLKQQEQISVVAFVLSLKNSNPSNPKPPQGELSNEVN